MGTDNILHDIALAIVNLGAAGFALRPHVEYSDGAPKILGWYARVDNHAACLGTSQVDAAAQLLRELYEGYSASMERQSAALGIARKVLAL